MRFLEKMGIKLKKIKKKKAKAKKINQRKSQLNYL